MPRYPKSIFLRKPSGLSSMRPPPKAPKAPKARRKRAKIEEVSIEEPDGMALVNDDTPEEQ